MDTAVNTTTEHRPQTLVLHGIKLPLAVVALRSGSDFIGDADWSEPLEHALKIAECVGTDINVRCGGTSIVVWWPPVDKDLPAVAIAVPLGAEFMKSSKRWCLRFAKSAKKASDRFVSTVKE